MKGIKVQKECQCTLVNLIKCHILMDWIGLNIHIIIITVEIKLSTASVQSVLLSPFLPKPNAKLSLTAMRGGTKNCQKTHASPC